MGHKTLCNVQTTFLLVETLNSYYERANAEMSRNPFFSIAGDSILTHLTY